MTAGSVEGHDFSSLVGTQLDRLAREVEAYDDESDLWVVRGAQKNSAGTLVLHVCGFLHHFIGAALGRNGYARDRPAPSYSSGSSTAATSSPVSWTDSTPTPWKPSTQERLQREWPASAHVPF